MKTFADLVRVRNLETGAIGRIARSLFENKAINNGILVEVDDTAKPYNPLFYKSKVAVEADEEDKKDADEVVPDENPSEDVTDA